VAEKKAIVTVAHAVIVIVWHVLATGRPCHELGGDYFLTRQDPDRETQRLKRQTPRTRPQGHPATRRGVIQPHSETPTAITGQGSLPPAGAKVDSRVSRRAPP
jgi:hypothetical protein